MTTDTAMRADLDALTALRRFTEIPAEDFLGSSPDGSLVDKTRFRRT